jgi:predicted DNA-binding transcriptional regulator YafY
MNLFEKIFNYQLISRLEDSGAFMVTSQERGWLKTMLLHPAAAEAFTSVTLDKLHAILEQEQTQDIGDQFIEKARSRETQVYHPLLRPLRRYILNKNGIQLSFRIKGDTAYSNQSGFPYKLEYSMVKREWYLLWYHLRHRTMMSTRLSKIISVSEELIKDDKSESVLLAIHTHLESRKAAAAIQVIREYNRELSRILYAFSCFEKEVEYDADRDLYSIKISFANNESEYVLSKIRFLGKRVKIIDGRQLQLRMYESAAKALERYGATEEA